MTPLEHEVILSCASLRTPAFVYNERLLEEAAYRMQAITACVDCKLLYSMKSLSEQSILNYLAPLVDGFSVSSVAEAMLGRGVLKSTGTVHFTSPGLRREDIDRIARTCDYVAFNSIPQFSKFSELFKLDCCGVRVNPQLSFVEDIRYAPCRPNSKLGIPLSQLRIAINDNPRMTSRIRGLHFHTNCDSHSFKALFETTSHIVEVLSQLRLDLNWINLGGGYLFNDCNDVELFRKSVAIMRRGFGAKDVFIEPGAAFVRRAGSVVSTIVDIFDSAGKTIVILDTTVNHMPEVFEYQYRPGISGDRSDGIYRYIFAGCTCLAGDVFGEYRFSMPLQEGMRVIFLDQGAYTVPKSHRFNGVELPAIYALTKDLQIEKMNSKPDYIENTLT